MRRVGQRGSRKANGRMGGRLLRAEGGAAQSTLLTGCATFTGRLQFFPRQPTTANRKCSVRYPSPVRVFPEGSGRRRSGQRRSKTRVDGPRHHRGSRPMACTAGYAERLVQRRELRGPVRPTRTSVLGPPARSWRVARCPHQCVSQAAASTYARVPKGPRAERGGARGDGERWRPHYTTHYSTRVGTYSR